MSAKPSARTPGNLREEIWNLPNTLTTLRIVAIPFVVWAMLINTPWSAFWGCLLFSAAAATDWLDGYIARRQGLVSLWGQFLDPVADKLIVLATTVTAVQLGNLPVWLVILLLSREIAVTSLRAIAASQGLTIHVLQTGKWKTALQLVGLISLLIGFPYEMDYLLWKGTVDFVAMGEALLILSVLLSLVSAGQYLYSFLDAIIEKRHFEPRKKRIKAWSRSQKKRKKTLRKRSL
jgi:CDP-diacylglycerol--glycerol-3-phosphate 3-phosphatidyltransferase